MKAFETLPEGYHEIYSVNLQTDKKVMILVNALSLLIAAVMGVIMHFFVPITTFFNYAGGRDAYLIRIFSFLGLSVLYIVLHEAVHGIAMRLCGTKKVKFGLRGAYAFAGSTDYYDKSGYIFIALAPVVLWGVVLAIINPFVPTEWFWVVYFLQMFNVSGAAGDFFVTIRFAKMPRDILVTDCGVGMTVFSKQM